MAILTADMRFFAAQYPTDDSYGGGPMSGNIVQDNVSQNVFPLIGESDAAVGRLQMRKVYAAVLSANTDRLVNAAVNVWTPPTDADVDVLQFKWGDAKTTRAEAAAALAAFPFVPSADGATGVVSGDLLLLGTTTTGPEGVIKNVQAVGIATGASTYNVIYNPSGASFTASWFAETSADAPKCCGSAEVATGVSSGTDTVEVTRLWGRVVPNLTPYPSAPTGIVSTALARTLGQVPIFRVGETVLLRSADGLTSEVAVVESIDWLANEITFTANLTNSYSAGAFVTSMVQLGDLQAEVATSFSQQTWTRVFSDTLIGNPIGANYNRVAGPIVLTNEGAATERWAFVFTSATDFKLIGESFGQIATGSTGTDFSPINPYTSQPLFTIDADGWGTGWQAGNVLRLNTVGARAPFWATRCISPGASASTDSAVFQFRGSY